MLQQSLFRCSYNAGWIDGMGIVPVECLPGGFESALLFRIGEWDGYIRLYYRCTAAPFPVDQPAFDTGAKEKRKYDDEECESEHTRGIGLRKRRLKQCSKTGIAK